MAVSQRLRYEVLRRDNHACRYCGAAAPDVQLTVDHVIPVALGGSDDPTNLVTACRSCNSGKAASVPDAPLVADVAADALRWARAMEVAVRGQARDLKDLEYYLEAVDVVWSGWTSTYDDQPFPRPSNWRSGTESFWDRRTSMQEWQYAIRKAMEHPTVRYDQKWRYTCGVLWRRIEERTEGALHIADVLAADDRPGAS